MFTDLFKNINNNLNRKILLSFLLGWIFGTIISIIIYFVAVDTTEKTNRSYLNSEIKNSFPKKQERDSTFPIVENKKDANQTTLYKVIKIVDGDTLDVEINGTKERIRLIGINTPEVVDPRKTVECFGQEASKKAKEILLNRKVKLEIDSTQNNRDKYGRLLRYVYRDDGLFYNKWMVENGYAHEYTYKIPYKFQIEFQQAENYAKENKLGLWHPDACKPEDKKLK